MSEKDIILRSVDDVRAYFSHIKIPYYFISATNFNLINLHQWVGSWHNINFIDCYSGSHPSMTIPTYDLPPLFNSSEEINSYLLGHKDVVDKIDDDRKSLDVPCPNSRAVFLYFDKEIEDVCDKLNIDICLPENSLVKKVDNKIVTTEIGNAAGVPSVPNILEKIDSYQTLLKVAKDNDLGSILVVQTAYGDSGKTTFFISEKRDYDEVADQIESEDLVKVMKRIRCASTAIEGCATRCGTFVGPLLTELIGYSELTPYAGGWCGNELYQASFSEQLRNKANELTQRLGSQLWKHGYRGCFEVDYLIDLDTEEVYLGEINPRITGISAMTNSSDFCCSHLPLFLFHLMEYSQCTLEVDPSEYNKHSITKGGDGIASQLIFKYTKSELNVICDAPVTGVYKLVGDHLVLVEACEDRRKALKKDQAFILRIMGEGEYAYKGADMAVIFLNVIVKDDEQSLTDDAKSFLSALKMLFSSRELTDEEQSLIERYNMSTELLKGHGAGGDKE